MIYFSDTIMKSPKYKAAAERLFNTLDHEKIEYTLLSGMRSIWLRDFMPVKVKSGGYRSFRYEPSYLSSMPDLKVNYRYDINGHFLLPDLMYSGINLDGGNIVFSPSKEKVIISDRIFSENCNRERESIVQELSSLLEAQIIIIPSLKSDFTGHADGMIRFVDEHTVIGNRTEFKNGLEQRIRSKLAQYSVDVIDYPYFSSNGISARGSYLNFLETETHLFLPVFGVEMDKEALSMTKTIFYKKIVPVNVNEIADDGGVLNCISWQV